MDHEAASFPPPPIYSEEIGRADWTPPASSMEDLESPAEENRGRRRLIYLSVAIIIAGLAGLGGCGHARVMAAVVTVTSSRVMWGWTWSGTALATIDQHLTTSLDQAWSERGPAIRLGQAR
jgi:hypothetical protein